MEFNNFLGYNPNMLKSVLLLVLAVSGNFVGNTLGCQTQFQMTNNMFVKHSILIFLIFFTLNYTTTENENPTDQIVRAFKIWICYILFTKQNITFTALSAGILIMTYIIDTFSIHYEKKLEDKNLEEEMNENKKMVDFLNIFKNVSFNLGILTIIIGFYMYFSEKYIEYGPKFNSIHFIFGKPSCDSLQN
jgi:hypothetical protein